MSKKIGLFTLGLCLITTGLLFLMDKVYSLVIIKDYYLLWPIFLIILGAEFILTKIYYDRKNVNSKISVSVGSIIALVIILSITTTTGALIFRPINIDFNFDGLTITKFKYDNLDVSHTLEKDILKESDTIAVYNERGDVNVTTSNVDKVSINATIRYSSDQKHPDLGNEIFNLKNTGSKFIIQTINPYSSDELRLHDVDIEITIPDDRYVDIKSQHGNINISNLRNSLKIKSKHGSVNAVNISGDADITTSYDFIFVESIGGNADIHNQHGEIEANNIGGKTYIENSHDPIIINNIESDLKVVSQHGRVEVYNIYGNLQLENQHDKVICREVTGDIEIDCQHGDIDISKISGSIDIQNEHADVSLTDLSTYDSLDITADTSYGAIKGSFSDNLSIIEESNNEKGETIIGNGKYKINITNRHGDIFLLN